MIVIDASVWVSLLLRQDVNYADTHNWMTKVFSSRIPIAAPLLLLAEVGGAIARRLSQPVMGERAIKRLAAIPTLRLVSIDHSLGIQAGNIAARYQLRGADAVYVTVAANLNVPLISWDNQQINRAVGLVNAFTPNQYKGII
jgi:predicted nucleic acid-binding protein